MRTCWQIREALAKRDCGERGRPAGAGAARKSPNGSGRAWRMDCQECEIFNSGVACWDQCSGCPCCCAPIDVTCDFCALYIEHRREIAGLPQN